MSNIRRDRQIRVHKLFASALEREKTRRGDDGSFIDFTERLGEELLGLNLKVPEKKKGRKHIAEQILGF